MKKAILSTVLLSGLFLASTTSVSASETAKISGPAKTEVEVNLKKDNGHDNGPGPYQDHLSITFKPTVFTFSGYTSTGSVKLTNDHEQKDQQYLAVNDDRKDATTGAATPGNWSVTGQLSTLTGSDSTGASIDLPAKLVFTPGALNEYNIGTTMNSDGTDLVPAEIGTTTENPATPAAAKGAYTIGETFTLNAGDTAETTVMSAGSLGDTDSKGVYTNLGNVDLVIANGDANNAANYKGTITWTLSADATAQ